MNIREKYLACAPQSADHTKAGTSCTRMGHARRSALARSDQAVRGERWADVRQCYFFFAAFFFAAFFFAAFFFAVFNFCLTSPNFACAFPRVFCALPFA